MTMQQFIRQNRKELDTVIRRAVPNIRTLDDSERRAWIENDEGLYYWAKSEGVAV